MKTILDLCGGTGSWSKYYSENGYNVVVATFPDWDVTNPHDQDKLIQMKPYGILAAPPCTMFSYARCDKTAKIPRDLKHGMETVIGCLNIIWGASHSQQLKFWALENPMGYLKLFLGKPAHTFQPWEYGDPYTKKTCLWGNFNEPKKNIVQPRILDQFKSGKRDFVSRTSYFTDLKQIPDGYLEKTKLSKRTVMRSMSPVGFAKQFYLANK